jgi:hypothetical protein
VPGERRRRLGRRQLAARRRPNPAPDSVFEATLEANVVHQFSGNGTIDMDCTRYGSIDVGAVHTKIIAIKVGEITSNDAVSG